MDPRWRSLAASYPSAPWAVNQAEFDRLRLLRNHVDHGNVVEQHRLILDNPSAHREAAIALLGFVYATLGSNRPGWW